MTRTPLFAAAGVTLLLAAPLAFAGHGRGGPDADRGHRDGESSGHQASRSERLEALYDAVDATPEQRASLDAIVDEAIATAGPLRAQAHETHRALDAATASGDEATAAGLEQRMEETRAQLKATRVAQRDAVKAILTPEQWTTLQDMRGARILGVGEGGHGGHGRGHGRRGPPSGA